MSLDTKKIDYIAETITRERFFEKVFERTESESAVDTVKGHIANLDYYSQDKYGKETDDILKDLREEMIETHSIQKALIFLDEFQTWLQKDHPNIIIRRGRNYSSKSILRRKKRSSVPSYFSSVRKYVSQMGGIRIHEDDIKLNISKPKPKGHYNEEDAKPLTSRMAQRVLEETKQDATRLVQMISNDAGLRVAEAAKTQGGHIKFHKKPVEITIPVDNSKGKQAGGIRYLRKQTAELAKRFYTNDVNYLLLPGKPSDYESKQLHKTIRNFKNRTLYRVRTIYNKLGKEFPEFLEIDPDTGRHTFNIHSWRKRCSTEYAKENGEAIDTYHNGKNTGAIPVKIHVEIIEE